MGEARQRGGGRKLEEYFHKRETKAVGENRPRGFLLPLIRLSGLFLCLSSSRVRGSLVFSSASGLLMSHSVSRTSVPRISRFPLAADDGETRLRYGAAGRHKKTVKRQTKEFFLFRSEYPFDGWMESLPALLTG